MTTSSPRSSILAGSRTATLAVFATMLVLVATASAIVGHATASGPNTAPILPTATPLRPTPTPRLVLSTPQVLAAWVSPQLAWEGPSSGPPTIAFMATGAFDVVLSCIPDAVGDSEQVVHPAIAFQLFDGNGHQIDNVRQSCGEAGSQAVHTATVPENVPAGSYQITILDSPAQASMLILAAQFVPQSSS